MEIYNQMEREELQKSIKIIESFGKAYKVSKINDFDWKAISEFHDLKEEDFYSAFVLIDGLKEQKTYLDINLMERMIVKKADERWKFIVTIKNKKKKISILHDFIF